MGERQVSGVRWTLRRNCSVSPSQMLGFYLSVCAVSLAIAAGFALNGAVVVLWFAGFELLLLGLALMLYARHVGDGDTIILSGPDLWISQVQGARERHFTFRSDWVSVEPSRAHDALIEVSGQGQAVRIGRFLRQELRATFARELRQALQSARLSMLNRA